MRDASSDSGVLWAAWHLLAAVVLVSGLSQLRIGPVWTADPESRLFFGAMGLSYAVCAAALTPFVHRAQPRWTVGTLVAVASLSGFLLFLVLADLDFPRSALVLGLVLVPALLAFPLFVPAAVRRLGVGALACAVAAVIAVGIATASETATSEPDYLVPSTSSRVVASTHYQLLVTGYHDVFGTPEANGGAVARFGDRLLLATSDGYLHPFQLPDAGSDLSPHPDPLRIPINRSEFVEDQTDTSEVNVSWFRVADVLVVGPPDAATILVSHHYWHSSDRCVTLRVSRVDASSAVFDGDGSPDWSTLFESEPCLPMKDRGHPFAGHQAGGRMASLDRQTVLLTVGDHAWDGVNSEEGYPQDPSASYGKVLRIDLDSGSATVFTLGHRNPQGLAVGDDGRIWETEHGPQGGDELNLIVEGENYGWPQTTYGVNYGATSWPLNAEPGRHAKFQRPVYTWLPSIGVSSVIQVRGRPFPAWAGDLLVGSLKDQTLWRIRLDGDRVRFAEPIELAGRIRDLERAPDGRVVLLTEEILENRSRYSIVVLEPALGPEARPGGGLTGLARGELVFNTRCVGCHLLDDGTARTIGPNLTGIVGSSVGSDPRFDYSSALEGMDGEWTKSRLDAFLTDPNAFAPGTSMQIEGVADEEDRSALIRFLRQRK